MGSTPQSTRQVENLLPKSHLPPSNLQTLQQILLHHFHLTPHQPQIPQHHQQSVRLQFIPNQSPMISYRNHEKSPHHQCQPLSSKTSKLFQAPLLHPCLSVSCVSIVSSPLFAFSVLFIINLLPNSPAQHPLFMSQTLYFEPQDLT